MITKREKQLSILIHLILILANAETKYPALEEVRKLKAPNPITANNGEMEEAGFWENNDNLIRQAWSEWKHEEQKQRSSSAPFTHEKINWNGTLASIVNETLLEAINLTHGNPWKENELKSLWKEVAPGVYAIQLLQPDKIHMVRECLDSISKSGIPTRRPNGMNRYGYILEPDTPGSVLISPLNRFYTNLAEHVLRPIGRAFFPQYYSIHDNNDEESYAFTIRYKQNEDVSLNEHSDASLVTLNINLNLPGEEAFYNNNNYNHSPQIYFLNDNGQKQNLTFTPGMALLHRGIKKHAAYPIQRGERTNLIIWLFGSDGYVRIKPYGKISERMNYWNKKPSCSTNY